MKNKNSSIPNISCKNDYFWSPNTFWKGKSLNSSSIYSTKGNLRKLFVEKHIFLKENEALFQQS